MMIFSRLSFFIVCILMLVAGTGGGADAAPSGEKVQQETQAKLKRIQAERKRLKQIRLQLEKKLGKLGRQLKKLDRALVAARKQSQQARQRVRQADRKLADLLRQKKHLQQRIDTLQMRLKDEAVAAWQRSARSSQWLGVLTGESVSDIPHRRYLLHAVMQSQAEDRRQYQQSVREMRSLETALRQQRDRLSVLSAARKKAEKAVAAEFERKRALVVKAKSEVRSKKTKEARLAREQQALLALLEHLDEGLLAMDQPKQSKHVRKRKGRLHWPLTGKIVASFGSRPQSGRARLKGVQIKPLGRRQVKAMAVGQVRYADWFGGYGLMTIVDYGDGVLGVYAHNDVLYRQLGDWVEEGEVLADAGSTGWVNQVALYFEIRDKGKAVNPKRWCRR